MCINTGKVLTYLLLTKFIFEKIMRHQKKMKDSAWLTFWNGTQTLNFEVQCTKFMQHIVLAWNIKTNAYNFTILMYHSHAWLHLPTTKPLKTVSHLTIPCPILVLILFVTFSFFCRKPYHPSCTFEICSTCSRCSKTVRGWRSWLWGTV